MGRVNGEMVGPRWDEEMTSAMVKTLSPCDRGLRTLASLTRKVELLERWAREGAPHGAAVPRNLTKLRKWTDLEFCLWPWSDPQVDHHAGRNSLLIARFKGALAAIAVRERRSPSNLRTEIEARDQIIASLERQNMELINQVAHLQTRVLQPKIDRR